MSGSVSFGCAISEDRRHGAIVAAGRNEASGKLLVDLSPFYDHPRLLVARMSGLYLKHDPVAVVVNPKSQSGTLVKPLADEGIVVVQPGAQDVAVAHGEFLDLVNDGKLEHLDQGPLTAAVRAAQQRPLAGAQAWEPKVAVDQSPLVAATLAAWAFLRWEELSQPGAWVVLEVYRYTAIRGQAEDAREQARHDLRQGERSRGCPDRHGARRPHAVGVPALARHPQREASRTRHRSPARARAATGARS